VRPRHQVCNGQVHAIRADQAFDGERFVAGGATVLIEDGTIVAVEPASYDVPGDCPVSDQRDATLLPGLVDAHVHLVADSGPLALDRVAGYTEEELDAVVTGSLERQLAAGVTSVRDLGDRDFHVVGRRDRQRTGDDGLPRIVASGPPLTTPAGHCFYLGGEVAGREQIVAAVRERVDRGVDVVKVMASGGMNTVGTDVTAPQFDLADLRLVVEESHRAGLPVTAHAHAAVAVDQALDAGVDGLEHASYFVGGGPGAPAGPMAVVASDEQLDRLAASGVAVCPTLGGFTTGLFEHGPPHVREMMRAAGVTPEQVVELRMTLLARMRAAGVRLVSGTDGGIAPPKAHGSLAEAMLELATVLPVADVLATATSGAAGVCAPDRRTGRLRAGYGADLLVVDGDLAGDLTALRRVRQVVLRGRPTAPAAQAERTSLRSRASGP